MTMRTLTCPVMAACLLIAATGTAVGQNDWQSPDPYFGVFQHRSAGTPQAEQRYRAEIAPQQHRRLHDLHAAPPAAPGRWLRHRRRAIQGGAASSSAPASR